MSEETTTLAYLLSGSTLILALAAFYVGRALWIARHEWPQCRTDTKILYLLVAPLLTFAVDLLAFTDRLFWSPQASARPVRARARSRSIAPMRAKVALRSDA